MKAYRGVSAGSPRLTVQGSTEAFEQGTPGAAVGLGGIYDWAAYLVEVDDPQQAHRAAQERGRRKCGRGYGEPSLGYRERVLWVGQHAHTLERRRCGLGFGLGSAGHNPHNRRASGISSTPVPAVDDVPSFDQVASASAGRLVTHGQRGFHLSVGRAFGPTPFDVGPDLLTRRRRLVAVQR